MHILVTGAAGFIGHHLSVRFCRDGHSVVGLDNLNAYYSPELKQSRLARMASFPAFRFERMDICDGDDIEGLFAREHFTHVAHMAAQAGVRYSLENPLAYARSNLYGFSVILEACRSHAVEHLLFASSSSVYGRSAVKPFSASAQGGADHPVSLYAATKRSNELCAHSYSSVYGLPATGLRFFTVYGPWGRPDMALFIFTRAILEGRDVPVFNMGRQCRDFTYIDDVVEAVATLLPHRPAPVPDGITPDPSCSAAPFRIYNVGAEHPTPLPDFITVLEDCLGRRARLELLPPRPGDVDETCADIEPLHRATGFSPRISLRQGISAFVAWYRDYYGHSDEG
ncbi:MAG: NAD-dependent epimerase/dehydratase family protein [Desulfovibrio sp.]|jgi:UDP-glucuronate 4-epimerase|nr:NAD-dependent epimerase/dehydratase family protein [Desulfovibrio sp.]